MIQKFIDKFMEQKAVIQKQFEEAHPESYLAIVKAVVRVIGDDEYGNPDPERIHQIDDGDYQGTLVFIIAEMGYQPCTYWSVMVGYGSCSGCDTLQSISGYSDDKPSPEQVKDYMTLALHIVQAIHVLGGMDV